MAPATQSVHGDVIASPANPVIKHVRALQRRKIRQQERAFVVEGVRAVDDILAAGMGPRLILVREDLDPADIPTAPDGTVIRIVERRIFDDLTEVPHPQGILAIVPMLESPSLPDADRQPAPLVIVADGIRDPGNLGTLLRSAAGAGVDHVVIGPESVDPYHPRAVRAAMGAHVRVPFSLQSWESMAAILRKYGVVAVGDADGDTDYDAVDWRQPAVIIVGGEAFGPTAEAWDLATTLVQIPLAGDVESLNAGVAGSLLMFEAARQRRLANR